MLVVGLTVGATAVAVTGGAQPAAAVTCTIATTQRAGSVGPAVVCVQSRLVELGFRPGPLDGAFGSMTKSAVIAFQRSRRLYADGIVGPKTGTAMGIWSTVASSPACAPPAGVPDSAGQVVVVTASGSTARVDLLVRGAAGWTCARTAMPGRVGRNGVRPLAVRRSGDGTTPGGVFPLATMTAPNGTLFQFFGNGTNPGVRGRWHQVAWGDCWVATPHVAQYNTLVRRAPTSCTGDDEYLAHVTGAYSAAAVIGANTGPDRSGDRPDEPALAAAIFLHRFSYTSTGATKPTSGCVSLSQTNLNAVLRALVPGQAWFVIR